MKTKEDNVLADKEIENVSGGQFVLDIDAAKQDNTRVSLYEQNDTKAQKWVLEEDESGKAYCKMP